MDCSTCQDYKVCLFEGISPALSYMERTVLSQKPSGHSTKKAWDAQTLEKRGTTWSYLQGAETEGRTKRGTTWSYLQGAETEGRTKRGGNMVISTRGQDRGQDQKGDNIVISTRG